MKFALTVLATIVLLLKMQLIGHAADMAETSLSSIDLREAGIELMAHAGAGLFLLLVPATMSVYKPRGMTPYGARKQLRTAAG